MKKIVLYIMFILGTISLFGCSLFNKSSKNNQNSSKSANKNYEQIWKDSFLYNQTTATNLPKKGRFDFEFSIAVQGDGNKLKELFKDFGSNNLKGEFNNIMRKVYGDYNFTGENKKLQINTKMYFNKSNFGLGDIDMSFDINEKGEVEYYINNLDRNFLDFIGLDTSTIDGLLGLATENKGKKLTYQLPPEIINQIISSINEQDNPLYKNTKQQEQQIIDAFLNTKVIEILGGKSIENNTDSIDFKLNTDNFIKFLNEVSKILNENKSFDNEKNLLKDITLKGSLNIKDKLIVDSNILLEFMLKGINEQTNKEQFEIITLQTKLKILDPKIMDFDILSSLSSANSPENQLIIRIKGLIK